MTEKSTGVILPHMTRQQPPIAAQDKVVAEVAPNIERAPEPADEPGPIRAKVEEVEEVTTRVTIAIPRSMHKRIKRGLVDKGSTIQDEGLRAFEKYFKNW